MAGTIAVDVSVQADNGVWSFPFSRSFSIEQGYPGSHDPLHYLSATPEVIALGELQAAYNHFAILFNIGGNPIQYGPDGGGGAMVPFGEIASGECAIVKLVAGMVLMAKATAYSAALWPIIFEV